MHHVFSQTLLADKSFFKNYGIENLDSSAVCEKSSKVIIFLQSLSMGRCSFFQVISKEADSQNRKSLLILRKIFHVVGGLRDSVWGST